MKTVKYGNYIFFDKKSVGSVSRLIRRYGVKRKSYAGEVLERIYYYYFGDAVNIKKEYKKFYKNEFDNVDMFLECHMGIPERVRRKLSAKRILFVNLDGKGQHIGDSFYYDDDGLKEQFWNMVGGLENENSSRLRYEQFFD